MRSILLALAAGGAVLVFWSVAIVYAGKPFPVFAALLGVAVGWGIRSGDLTAKRRPRLLAAAICYFLMSCSLLPNLWIGDDIPTHTEILRQYNEVIVPKSEGQMHEAASYEALKDQIVRRPNGRRAQSLHRLRHIFLGDPTLLPLLASAGSARDALLIHWPMAGLPDVRGDADGGLLRTIS